MACVFFLGQHGLHSEDKEPITVFVLEDSIGPAFHRKSLNCSIHGNIEISQAVPDLVSGKSYQF